MFEPVELSAEPGGPLHGVKIIDLSRLVAGNTLTMALGDMGADVIKVEPAKGDTLRDWKVEGVSTSWKSYCRNKRSLCIDFHHSESVEILLQLVRSAHVLVESFKPGTLENMHLSPEALFRANPALIIARISGWGQTGPYAQLPGFGTLAEGLSGFASMNGFADREPVLPPIFLADMTAGLYGAIGILSALRQVEVNGGRGQVIDIPLLDPLFSILGPQAANFRLTGKVKPRTGSRSTNSAPRNVYRTADDQWVCLSASTQGMVEKLFRAIGRPELSQDERFRTNTDRLNNFVELDAILSGFIAKHNQKECLALFNAAGVTVGPLYDMSNIETDPHFHARHIVVELPDAELGTVPVHNISPRLADTPGRFRRVAPALGEHTREVLHEAGYSPAEVEDFITRSVVCHSHQPQKRDTNA